MGLRGKGATKGATVSFLVSTPETGVDSIAITYALLDPLMALVRPLAAILSAIGAGFFESIFEEDKIDRPDLEVVGNACEDRESIPATFMERVAHGFSYAFGQLLRDLMPWLGGGILAAGAIAALIPAGWIGDTIGSGWAGKLLMLVLGIPMYVCATASTPVAAALIAKGLSPGAALVLLLTGPTTNAAALMAVRRMLGFRTTVRYLASVSVCALALGWLTDTIYTALGIKMHLGAFTAAEGENITLQLLSVILLALITGISFLRRRSVAGSCCG